MDQASEPSTRAPRRRALSCSLGLVGAALLGPLRRGRLGCGRDLPVGGAAVVLLAGAFVACASGGSPRRGWGARAPRSSARRSRVAVWTGVTMAWSIVPDRSWDSFNKSVAYVAFLGLGVLLAAAGAGSARLAAWLLALVLGARSPGRCSAKGVPGSTPRAIASPAFASPWATGTRSRSSPTWRSCSVSGSDDSGTPAQHARRGRAPRVRRDALAPAHPLACRCRGSRLGARALARAVARARRVGLLLVASAGPALLVGAWAFTEPRSDGRHRRPRGSRRRRHGLRHPRPRRSRSRSAPRRARLGRSLAERRRARLGRGGSR